jgi:hypothetical protein
VENSEETKLQKGIGRLKSLTSSIKESFKDDVEDFARANAIYSTEDYKESPVDVFLKDHECVKIGAGINSRVYKIKEKNWVIKEAKWDSKLQLFEGGPKIPFVMKVAEFVLGIFSFSFRPTKTNLMKDLSNYLEFSQYFGYNPEYKNSSVSREKILFASQERIRETLLFFKPDMERKYGIKLNGRITKILESDVKYHNFLPKEYQLVGKSISPENDGKATSYIFQEFVKGEMLADIPDKNLSRKHKEQLVLMVYLILLMHMQIGLLPDTKPRNFIINAYNWLTNTDNIVVHKDKLIFIDTRWFWDTNANYIKRGLMIPELIINRAKFSLADLLKDLED